MKAAVAIAFLSMGLLSCGGDGIKQARQGLVVVKKAIEVTDQVAAEEFLRKFNDGKPHKEEEVLPWYVASAALENAQSAALLVQSGLDLVEAGGSTTTLKVAVRELIRSLDVALKSLKECGIDIPPIFYEAVSIAHTAEKFL